MLTAILRNVRTNDIEYLHCTRVPPNIWRDDIEITIVARMSDRSLEDAYRYSTPSPHPHTAPEI